MSVPNLKPVITIDEDKCVNCHACIGVCPVKFCNDGSGDTVTLNSELCIGCGQCIEACTHDARSGVDDFEAFMEATERGEHIVAICAPAVAANFPGEYLRLNGWLKSVGVEAFFDVSFGAELTIKSYLEHVKRNTPKAVIAQPCPAIVTYIEIYRPELLQYLAPADSPMLHTIKLIKNYYGEYTSYRVCVISPCFAKRREFDETGFGDFNVTYKSLQKHFEENNIDIGRFDEVDFSNRPAERAVLFSTPGGLMRTLEREAPAAARKTRKIEGPELIYPYLDRLSESIANGEAPLLVDCLNCELGCNAGPGTLNVGGSPDTIEHRIEIRNEEMQRRYRNVVTRAVSKGRVRRMVNRYWRSGLYDRGYVDRSDTNRIEYPSNAKLEEIYRKMRKFREEDFLNCGACGYGRCELMAVAIHNGLNKPVNCFHYERSSRQEMSDMLIDRLRGTTSHISEFVRALAGNGTGTGSMSEITLVTEQTNDLVNNGVEYIRDTIAKIEEIQETSADTIGGVKNLGEQIEGIWEIVGIINSIAAQTKIIAFNAELEASSAGEKGKNFEIVASEIRRLADNTVVSTQEIRNKIKEIQNSSDNLVYAAQEEAVKIKEGRQLSDALEGIFKELTTHSDSSENQIQEIVGTQIENFKNTLRELENLTAELDTFSS
jgi:Na+-translocating ferredoxin:NAD+ oxidoreductase RNF subunit RnfB